MSALLEFEAQDVGKKRVRRLVGRQMRGHHEYLQERGT